MRLRSEAGDREGGRVPLLPAGGLGAAGVGDGCENDLDNRPVTAAIPAEKVQCFKTSSSHDICHVQRTSTLSMLLLFFLLMYVPGIALF